MKLVRIATIATATLSSACSFYVLTRSGLAGTLVGAAVAGTVYNLTSQGLTHGIDAGKDWFKRREVADKDGPNAAEAETVTESSSAVHERTDDDAGRGEETGTVGTTIRVRQSLSRWMPALLGLVAVALSISALLNEDPAPRVVTERIVTQPVVQERVIVEERTVTVTVPVVVAAAPISASGGGATSTSIPASSSTTEPPTTQPTSTTTSIRPETPVTTTPPVTEPVDADPARGTSDTDAN